ncbi:MAG: response regulator [Pseudodesulfovibrio sp.]|nr:response regulator [Pseudodesulfovibrio sp.]
MNENKLKILVVENERIVAWELMSRLKRLGHDVCATAATGEDAVRLALECLPSLVLMDIMLDGEMDGIEAAREIRYLLNLPVIFCSAFSKEMQVRAKEVSPLGFVEKPMNWNVLENLLSGVGNN